MNAYSYNRARYLRKFAQITITTPCRQHAFEKLISNGCPEKANPHKCPVQKAFKNVRASAPCLEMRSIIAMPMVDTLFKRRNKKQYLVGITTMNTKSSLIARCISLLTAVLSFTGLGGLSRERHARQRWGQSG